MKINCICSYCEATFLKHEAEIKRTNNNFCSKSCSGKYKAKKNHDDFFLRFERYGDCWNWTGNLNGSGYGYAKINGKVWLAHRYSYQAVKGDIPSGFEVMHSCDNPACINPQHLSLGSHVDNMNDMHAKERHHHIISNSQKIEIASSSESNKELAKRFVVSERTIRHVKTKGITHWMPLPAAPQQ